MGRFGASRRHNERRLSKTSRRYPRDFGVRNAINTLALHHWQKQKVLDCPSALFERTFHVTGRFQDRDAVTAVPGQCRQEWGGERGVPVPQPSFDNGSMTSRGDRSSRRLQPSVDRATDSSAD